MNIEILWDAVLIWNSFMHALHYEKILKEHASNTKNTIYIEVGL